MDAHRTAAVVVIGNEILSGRTQDANLAFLAQRLGSKGIRVAEARIVPDVEAMIVEAVNALRARYAYVFTTGGIGPTHDDVTARCIAVAFGIPVRRNPEAERRLRAYYDVAMLNEARLSMADMPEGADLIDNPVSIAPGFRVENVYVLPGVPQILQAMVDGLVPNLAGGDPVVSRPLTVFAAEGDVAAALAAIQDRFADVEIGSYPFFRQGRFGTTIVARGRDPSRVEAARNEVRNAASALGAESLSFDAADISDG